MVESQTLDSQVKDLEKALVSLQEALAAEKTELNRDGTIQRFEFCFELAWKLLKSANHALGVDCFSPKDCIRLAAQNELLDDPNLWFKYLDLRNLASHTYNEEMAERVYAQIAPFHQEASKVPQTVKKRLQIPG